MNKYAFNLTDEDLEKRINHAVELFKEGYNCSQSVVAAFADLYGYTPDQAFKMSSSFLVAVLDVCVKHVVQLVECFCL